MGKKDESKVGKFLSKLAKDIVEGNLSGYPNSLQKAVNIEIEKFNSNLFKDEPQTYSEKEKETYRNRVKNAAEKSNLKFSKTFKKLAEDSLINHPHYYGGKSDYEVIKVLEEWDLSFHKGNAVKYIYRSGKKSKNTEIEDLKKAIWYLERCIERKEQK